MRASDIATAIAFLIAAFCVIDAYRWNKGRQTLYKFFLLEGKLKLPFYTSALVAANLSLGNFIVFIATWGYNYGVAGILFFIINLVLNVAGFAVFFPRARWYIEDHDNNGTIHDYLSRAYAGDPRTGHAKHIRLLASVVTIVGLTLAIVFELSLAVGLLAASDKVEQIKFFGALAILVALFTAYGGFRTLITSDIANASILTLAVFALVYMVWAYWSTTNDAPPLALSIGTSDFVNFGWPNAISILVIGSGWMLVAMDQWQRTCASRSFPTALEGLLIYFPIVALFAVAFALWGAFDKAVMPMITSEPVRSALSGANNPLLDIGALPISGSSPRYLILFVVSGLVFAAISTTNTFLNVCSHSFTTDILVGSISNRSLVELNDTGNRLYVGVARAVIIGMVVLIMACYMVLVIGDLLKDPLSFFFIAYSVQFALLPSMVMSIFSQRWRPPESAVMWSLSIGFIGALTGGLGAWLLSQATSQPLLMLAPADWVTLAPVVTVVMGFLPLIIGIGKRKP